MKHTEKETTNGHAACVLLIREDGKILSASRRGNFNDIGLIGGKVDQGEEPWEAAIRETHEEAGIFLSKNDIEKFFERVNDSKAGKFITETFLCYTVNVNPKISIETPLEVEKGIQIKWSTWAEMLDKKNSFSSYNEMLYNHYCGKDDI